MTGWSIVKAELGTLSHSPFHCKAFSGIFIANRLIIHSGCLGVNSHVDLASLWPFVKANGAPRHIPARKALYQRLAFVRCNYKCHLTVLRASQSHPGSPHSPFNYFLWVADAINTNISSHLGSKPPPCYIPQDCLLVSSWSLSPSICLCECCCPVWNHCHSAVSSDCCADEDRSNSQTCVIFPFSNLFYFVSFSEFLYQIFSLVFFFAPSANATLVTVVFIVPLAQGKKMLIPSVASFVFISHNSKLKEEPPRV